MTSAIPALADYQVQITVAVVLLLFFGNLRGLREAGRTFAFPTYFFVISVGLVIVLGLFREITGDLPRYATDLPHQFPSAGGAPCWASARSTSWPRRSPTAARR
jgi:amino acid transporter